MKPIFVDTSVWYAYFSHLDHNHSIAVSQIEKINVPLVTSDYVIDETITLVSRRVSARLSYEIGNDLLNERFAKIIQVTIEDAKNALKILAKYADKEFSFTDCVSFVLMEKLGIETALSFDIHFEQYGKFIILP